MKLAGLLGLWCLMPLSTIFQLYRGSQFYWWRKLECQDKTTDLPHVSAGLLAIHYWLSKPSYSNSLLISNVCVKDLILVKMLSHDTIFRPIFSFDKILLCEYKVDWRMLNRNIVSKSVGVLLNSHQTVWWESYCEKSKK